MRKSHSRVAFIPLFCLIISVLACDFPFQTRGFPEATQTMQALATRVAAQGDSSAVSPEDSSNPDEAPLSATTPSPTACVASVSVTVDTNCRSGPGQDYPYLGALLVGEQAPLVGQSSEGGFWVIDNPDNPGEDCWIWDAYAQVTCDTSSLPVMEPPPLLPDWNGTWTCWSDDTTSLDPSPFQVTVVHNGEQMTVYANVDGEQCVYDVTLDEDYMGAHGTCPNPDYISDYYLFWSFLENWNQLRGSVGGNWGPWCCARNGYPRPEPCENY